MNQEVEARALPRRATAGPALHGHSLLPAVGLRAVVGLLPGYADHGGRYAHVMKAWAERGIGSVALDLRGHGRSHGGRGACRRFAEYDDDVTELLREIQERTRAPAFLFGHSFGGLVALARVLRDPEPWRGLLLSAPWLALARPPPLARSLAARLFSRLAPNLSVPSGLTGAAMTQDPERARAYDVDPLVFRTANSRFLVEAQAAQPHIVARASSLSLPLYVTLGTHDRVVRLATAKQFFERASSPDKTWEECEGLRHEVLSESGWRAIAGRMADWMLRRSS